MIEKPGRPGLDHPFTGASRHRRALWAASGMRGSPPHEAGRIPIVVVSDQIGATWTWANLVNQYVPAGNTASSPRRHRSRAYLYAHRNER